MLGENATATQLRRKAEAFAAEWARMADDGDHYRLAFDKPGTWSQKYNLVWDRVLGLRLFPPTVAKKELAYYRKIQKTYGVPLDSRTAYTKLDWIFWSASITGERADFEALTDPVYRFLQETPDRVPMTDWYWTQNAKVRGFRARPVVGGLFMRLLDSPSVWKKWVAAADTCTGPWAPFPKPLIITEVVATSRKEPAQWRYTLHEPRRGWHAPSFDDSSWKRGPGGFGHADTPGAVVRTEWTTPAIWLRRDFVLDSVPRGTELQLLIHHDEDVLVFLNGTRIFRRKGYTTDYELAPISDGAALRPGRNTLAVHCTQTMGGQYIDVGIVRAEYRDEVYHLKDR
jgi:hypothetical protein